MNAKDLPYKAKSQNCTIEDNCFMVRADVTKNRNNLVMNDHIINNKCVLSCN